MPGAARETSRPPRLLTSPRLAILRIMRGKWIPALALLSLLVAANAARADELVLKDGTKITGTIIGFENDSFRVETSYGFALIRKDKVADISITAAKKEPEPKAKSAAAPEPASSTMPTAEPAIAKEPSPAASSYSGRERDRAHARASKHSGARKRFCENRSGRPKNKNRGRSRARRAGATSSSAASARAGRDPR